MSAVFFVFNRHFKNKATTNVNVHLIVSKSRQYKITHTFTIKRHAKYKNIADKRKVTCKQLPGGLLAIKRLQILKYRLLNHFLKVYNVDLNMATKKSLFFPSTKSRIRKLCNLVSHRSKVVR